MKYRHRAVVSVRELRRKKKYRAELARQARPHKKMVIGAPMTSARLPVSRLPKGILAK